MARIVRFGVLFLCLTALWPLPSFATGQRGSQSTQQAAKFPERISIAGGPAGGAYYPISLGCAKIFMDSIKGLQVDVATSAGSVENPLLIGQGEHDMGISNSDAILEAFSGTKRFTGKKQENLRLLFSGLAGGGFHAVTGKDITSFEQLKGKHIAMGPEGGSTRVVALQVLKAYGIEAADIKMSYLPYDEGMTMLMDGQVDASFAAGAWPLSALQQLAANANFKYNLLSVDMEKAKRLTAENRALSIATLPAGTYQRQEKDVIVLETGNYMLINATLDERFVYALTKSIFENLPVLYAAHPSTKALVLKSAVNELIPFHPGARKYFVEQGVLGK